MKIFLPFAFIFLMQGFLFAQESGYPEPETVGLVLSGGGAKGIAHIGMIQALEEKEIPIDYITGTSMGAIIGGLYATGYSPEEILKIFASEDFYQSYTGDLSCFPAYHFRSGKADPDILNFSLSVKGYNRMALGITGIALVDPAALNFTSFELFAPASTAAGNDFDHLFVPFRCVASDIYKKRELVFDKGNLARAIQMSMSIPFYFKPLKNEDEKVLIDGGVYNNLPIQPMANAFHPDFIIATAVYNSGKPQIITDDIGEFFTNMLLQRTDSLKADQKGIFIDLNMDEVGMMDFAAYRKAYSIGYREGLVMADSIRKVIHRRKKAEEVSEARKMYRESIPEITFNDLKFKGITEEQEVYFRESFWKNRDHPYSLSAFKHDYFNLMAGNSNLEIVPVIDYHPESGNYSLLLEIHTSQDPRISIGGNLSSINANQLYVGLQLSRFTRFPVDYNLDLYWGNFLNAVAFTSNLERLGRIPARYQFKTAFNYFRYSEPDQVFFEYSKPMFNQQEYYAKLKMTNPFFFKSKIETFMGFGYLQDRYTSFIPERIETDPRRKSVYRLGQAGVTLSRSRMNNKLYPMEGYDYNCTGMYHLGKNSVEQQINGKYHSVYDSDLSFFTGKLKLEKYLELGSLFRLGGSFHAVFSNYSLGYDYQSTVLQAPAFTPTPYSEVTFNPDLRATQFLATGIAPVLKFNSTTHLRLDNYLFMPVTPIIDRNGSAESGNAFTNNVYFGELTFVINFPILSIGIFTNYYSRAESNFNFGLNIGYPIFNERFK